MKIIRVNYLVLSLVAILALFSVTNITLDKVSGATGSILLNNVQSTSATVSSSPYQITVSNVNGGAGTDNLIVVGVSANNNAVTSVTYGGVLLTRAVSSFANNDAEFWYLANPSGTGNVVVTMAGSTSAVVGVYSFSGVDQTTPVPTSATNHNSGTGSSPTISITTANPNSWVLDLPAIYGGKTLSAPTCTQEWNVNMPSTITGASSSTIQSSAGSVTCGWTSSGSGDLWDDVAVEVKAAGISNPTVPGSPTGLTATASSSSQINLSWAAPSNNGGSAITGYKVERSSDGGTTWSTVQSNTGSTATTYSDTGLAASTTYTYRVSAINSVGTGSPSNTASATTQSGGTSCSTTSRAICLSTNTVNVGTDVRVTGSKFAANSPITLSFDGTAIGTFGQDIASGNTSPAGITTDSNGNFVAIIQVLVTTAGTHTISAKDTSNSASQLVTVSPHAYIFPTTGKPGSTVLIPASQGNGYAANSAITIKFDGATITPTSTITADSSGNFGGKFTVPSTATTGSHTITISDSKGDTYSTSFNVDPNAHSFSSQVVATGLVNGNDLAGYFAFIPDNGPRVDGSGAFMANEKNSGNVVVFKNVNGQFVKQSVLFVTVPNLQVNYETNGLMGIAFDPNWITSKYVYFYVTRTVSNNVVGEVIRYHATTDSSGNIVADSSVGEQLVMGNIPAFNNGHNGGSLKFDSQGNLYISTGDGWTFVGAQDLTSYQGKILRITPVATPVNGKLYTIPSSNPYASSTNTSIKKEIWAIGQRNPYSFDIDSMTGKVYISDTGFNTWEFISNATVAGSNDGWPNYERPPPGNPNNLSNYVSQLYWYPHQGVEPLTGPATGLEALSAGAFYHGTAYPGLDGAYFFGDYGVGKIEALLPTSVATPSVDPVSGYPVDKIQPILYGLTLGPVYMQEWNGKLYFLDLNGNVNVLNYN